MPDEIRMQTVGKQKSTLFLAFLVCFPNKKSNFAAMQQQNHASAPSRLIWVDSLKGWLILLVVVGHCIQYVQGSATERDHLWNLIYSFHMPAFMAVSGWLVYRPDDKGKPLAAICVRRAWQLLVPHVCWSVLRLICLGEPHLFVSEYLMQPHAHFWFLWVLFFISVLFVLVQKLNKRLRMNETVLIVAVCLLLTGMMVGLELRLLGFQFIAYYFLFYALGYFIHRHSCLQTSSKPLLLVLLVIWMPLAWWWQMHGLPSWMPALPHVVESVAQYTYRGLTAAVAILFLLNASPLVLNGQGAGNKWMALLGKWSLGIYTSHLLLVIFLRDGLCALYDSWTVTSLEVMIFILLLPLSILVVYLLARWKWTARFMLGKI